MSPCSELDMTPSTIIDEAILRGINIIAVADHNSAEHVAVTARLARRHDLIALPAMEISSSEEAHILALFESVDSCMDLQKIVYDNLPDVPGYSHDETSQPVVNENDEVLFFNHHPLINATSLTLASVVDLIHRHKGIAIASHIDRETFSIISQLGFIPDDLALDGVELSWRIRSSQQAHGLVPQQKYPVVSFSDAHHVQDIGRRVTEFSMHEPTFRELVLCLEGAEGRSARIVY